MPGLYRALALALMYIPVLVLGQSAAPQSAAQAAPAPVGNAPSATKVEMPSDPAALLALAAKKNGLQNVTSAPWHLKASYEVLDDASRTTDSGTFEEFWISSSKSRSRYTSLSFNQTSIANDEGFYREAI
jgi:hypothetical protein